MATFTSPTDIVVGSLAKSSDINNLDAAVVNAFALLPTNASINEGTISFAVDTGIADAYLVSLQMAPVSYTDGMVVTMRPINSNTGACTVNVNSIGVKTIKTENNSTPVAGDIVAGVPVELKYSTGTACFHISKNSAAQSALAQASAAAALVSENAALGSKNAAAVSAAAASGSQIAAAASAAAELISQNAASGSASAALISQNAAAGSAVTATNKANDASGYASAALISQNAASSSASAALISENATAALYDSFDDRYLGAKAVDPVVDNDGNALIVGAMYFNTVSNAMKVYSGSVWTLIQVFAAGATTDILVGGGAGVAPVWTAATGTGAPVRQSSPTITTGFKYTGGTPGLGKVLTSDADGDASWETLPASGHTIIDEDGDPMTTRANLEFTGTGVKVTDATPNTVVTIENGVIAWTVVTSATNAVKSCGYLCDTLTTAAFTLTLPPTPTPGDIVGIADAATYFATNKLTIGRNGEKIMGVAADMEVTTDNAAFTLVYSDATNGWRITNIVTPSSDYIGMGAIQYLAVSSKTTDGTLTAGELTGNRAINNTGAGGAVNLTLQPAVTGLGLKRVQNTVAQYLRLTADGTDKFRYGSTEGAAGGYIRTNVIGVGYALTCLEDGYWDITDLMPPLKYDE